jgi:hypothetical protein
MCTVLLPRGGYPIAVNKYVYIISYHILLLSSSCHYPFLFPSPPTLNVVVSPPSPMPILSFLLLYRPDLHSFFVQNLKGQVRFIEVPDDVT